MTNFLEKIVNDKKQSLELIKKNKSLDTLEKNIKTTVPQFIAVNDKIVISTTDGSYIEKSKN